jgi:hypothetical protein
MILTPNIYSTGLWKVKNPYKINEQVVYTCSAIHSFESLRNNGVDPYQQFYKPFNIDYNKFKNDEFKKATIITLTSKYAKTINVPDTYLENYPRDTRIPYSHMVISLSLGALPTQLPLNFLKEPLEYLIKQKIGINPTVKFHTTKIHNEPVTVEDHEIYERNRKKNIKDVETPDIIINSLKNENEKLKETIRVLEKLVLEKI